MSMAITFHFQISKVESVMTLYLAAAKKKEMNMSDYNINNSSINLAYIITKIPIQLSFYPIHLTYWASRIAKLLNNLLHIWLY